MAFLFLLLVCMCFCVSPLNASAVTVDVGIVLDLDTTNGKVSRTSMLMAVEDFYANHNYTRKIIPHIRDSKSENVHAASAAIDLLTNVQVQAIVGPQRSTQADFVIDIGEKVKIPVISPATSPLLSPNESPNFIRSAQCSSFQAKAIAAIVKAFGWRQVVFVYEDSNYGSGTMPFLIDAMVQTNTLVPYRSVISPSATNDQILKELYKLKTMQTRVFVVHMLPSLASRFFLCVKEAGMMTKGYAWIISDALTSLLDSVDSSTVAEAMEGVLGVKAHIPKSYELDVFTRRWKRKFREENPDIYTSELNVFGLWAYDSITALAMAVEKVGVSSVGFERPVTRDNLTDLDAIGSSNIGPLLVKSVRNIRFKGLSGDYHIIDGQLQPSAYEIVNVIGRERRIGYWTKKYGISNKIYQNDHEAAYSTSKDSLGPIIWPGETTVVPRGWEMPTSGNKLRVGIPVKNGFSEFVKVDRDPQTNAVIATGFCIEVFREVMQSLPYAVPFDLIPFEHPDRQNTDYNDLLQQIILGKYDAVIGDITIVANRSRFVDFTLPFTESGVSTIVPIKNDQRKNAWIFMKPLTMDLWLTIAAFFIFTGFVVWVLEHGVNEEFRGPPHKQVGMIFWFSFSTLVFAHKEKITSNLTRFVVIVWVFVVLVLTSSYTASLTSLLTVQQLEPMITDISDLIKNGEYVGYQDGSFVAGLLENMKFDRSTFRNYSTLEEYDEALSLGSRNGGVAAIVDELPYIRLFLAKYCHKYTMVGPTYKAAGFGFAFPKGSPLVTDVSTAILNVTEAEKMVRISRQWLGEEEGCPNKDEKVISSDSLTLDSFKGLFLIAGVTSASALAIFVTIFFYENRVILASDASVGQKVSALAKIFNEVNDKASSKTSKCPAESTVVSPETRHGFSPESSGNSISHHLEGIFSQDEGFSTTEPGTPFHDPSEANFRNL